MVDLLWNWLLASTESVHLTLQFIRWSSYQHMGGLELLNAHKLSLPD